MQLVTRPITTVLTQLQFVTKLTTDVAVFPMMIVKLETSVTQTRTYVCLSARRTMSVNNGIIFAMIIMTTVTIVVLHQIVMTLDVAPVVALISTVNTQNQFVEIITNVDAMWTKIVRLEINVIKIPISVKLKQVPIC